MSDQQPFTIRRLISKDIDVFRSLLDVFGDAFEEPRTYMEAQPSDGYLAGLLSNEQFMVVAALQSDTVIGGLVAYELKKFEQERSEIYIYDLAVASTHRRRGIATQLIKHLQSIGSECGAYVIFVQADLGDDPAIKLYSKLGVREDVLHFDIAVE